MKLTYPEFLDTVKVIRMLYGVDVASAFFEKTMDKYLGKPLSPEFFELTSTK